MIWSKTLKYPMLTVGIILMIIYITDPKTKAYWEKVKTRYYPDRYTCSAITQRIEEKKPDNWSIHCPENSLLLVRIDYQEEEGDKFPESKVKMYRLMANSILKLGKLSNPETMDKVRKVKISLQSNRLNILAQSDGAAIVKIRKAIYEYDIKDVTKKANRLASTRSFTSDDEKKSFIETEAKKMRQKLIAENQKDLPRLLKSLVRIKETIL